MGKIALTHDVGSDFNIVPTSTDLQLAKRGDELEVVDVRADSAADAAGIRPGWVMVSVDGVQMEDAVLQPFGETLPVPTPAQLDYAATLVANGRRTGPREVVFRTPNGTR